MKLRDILTLLEAHYEEYPKLAGVFRGLLLLANETETVAGLKPADSPPPIMPPNTDA